MRREDVLQLGPMVWFGRKISIYIYGYALTLLSHACAVRTSSSRGPWFGLVFSPLYSKGGTWFVLVERFLYIWLSFSLALSHMRSEDVFQQGLMVWFGFLPLVYQEGPMVWFWYKDFFLYMVKL
jgi:hypothetical protein